MVMCHLSDPSNINQISRQIGSVCRHDGLCLWTDCLLDLFITDPALVITLYKSHFHSFFLKIIDRPEDRIMLQYSRNYMISRIYQSPIAVFRLSVELDVNAICFGSSAPKSFARRSLAS